MLARLARLTPRLRGVRLNSTNRLSKSEPSSAQKQANLNNGAPSMRGALTAAKMLGVGVAAVAGGAYYKWGRKPPRSAQK